MAFKGHSGYNGFLPPYQTKYLKRVVKVSYDISGLTYLNGNHITGPQVTVYQDEFDIDPLTGFVSNTPNGTTGGRGFPFFGIPVPPSQPPPGPSYVVNDDYYSITTYQSLPPLLGFAKSITEVTLSNQYTLAQLDADTDALINAIDPASIPWGQGQVVIYENDSLGGPDRVAFYQGFTQEMLPQVAQYYPPRGPFVPMPTPPFGRSLPSPWSIPALNAAAGYVYAPSPFGEPIIAPYDAPGAYMKFISYIQMAGNYCRKNFYVDWNQNLISEGCQSGQGGCGASFRVDPPPIIVGQDAYTQLVPNCRCAN